MIAAFVQGTASVSAACVAAFFAWRAQRFSRPVGNGFARETKDSLGRIELMGESLARIENKIDHHVEWHAEHATETESQRRRRW